MTGWKEGVAVFAGLCALTTVLTYPLVLHLPTAITDPGDPLFSSWRARPSRPLARGLISRAVRPIMRP